MAGRQGGGERLVFGSPLAAAVWGLCGLRAFYHMLLHASGMSVLAAGSIGCLTAMAGADVAIGLYERWAAKRLGVCDVPPSGGGQA